MAPPDVVAAYDQRVARVKEQEKAVEDAKSETQKEIRESLALQSGKYAVAAWKLQNKQKRKANLDPVSATLAAVNDKMTLANIAKESDLKDFVIEAWAKFLSGDALQKKPYLAPFKDVIAAQDANTDLSSESSALSAVQTVADQLQKDIAAALETRKAKQPLDKPAEELLKDIVDDDKAPCSVPKEKRDQIDKLISAERRQKNDELKKELEERKKGVGESIPSLTASRTELPRISTCIFAATTKNRGTKCPGGSSKS